MISGLLDQLQGVMGWLDEIDSIECQNHNYRDEMIKDMLHYIHGMGMPPPPPHYGQTRV